jgi:hypothetical protein
VSHIITQMFQLHPTTRHLYRSGFLTRLTRETLTPTLKNPYGAGYGIWSGQGMGYP